MDLAGQETDGYSATTVQVRIEDSRGAQFGSCSTHIPLATDIDLNIDPVHPTTAQSKKRHWEERWGRALKRKKLAQTY